MITLSNVSKFWNKNVCALKDIQFSIKEGERVAIVGQNGAGKSTLFKLLMGLTFPSSGCIEIAGKTISADLSVTRKKIGYLPENAPLLTDLTPKIYLENLAELYGLANKESVERVKKECQLDIVWERRISKLSKGFRQRVALAGTVIHDPEILILDEPTVGLDPLQIQQFRQMILKMSNNKILLFSTHVLSEVENICDRCIYFETGHIKRDLKIGHGSQFWKICYRGEWPNDISIVENSLKDNYNDNWLTCVIDSQTPESIISKLCEKNVSIRSVEPLKGNLEALFSE
jgi:ABC-2 type transport system ATP-binding protein